MKLIRPTAVVAAVALASLTACSSSGGGTTPATSAQLKSTLLASGDLPSSWVAKAHDSSEDDSSQDKSTNSQLASCLGIPKSALEDSAADDAKTVHSPDFTYGQAVVSSDAEPDSGGSDGFSQALAQSVLTSSKANSCFSTVLRKTLASSLPSSASIDQLDVKVSKPRSSDPKNLRFRFDATIKVSAGGQSLALYLSEVQISDHGASDTVEFEGSGSPVPDDVQASAIKAVSGRVDKL